jgi:cation:H+ antiporter
MESLPALLTLVAGLVLVVAGAELFFKGVLASSSRLGVSPFVLTVVVSGFELENLAAGIAANANGLSGAAAGTFLGGTTFLALGVAGAGALIAPMRARLPGSLLAWVAASPLPLLVLGLDGELSRLDGGLLLAWFAIALFGLVRSGRGVLGERQPPERRRAPLVRLVGGLAVLSAGGEILGEGIRTVVSRFGVSDTLLGNTVIAASVEAEELGRVAVPARRGRGDIARQHRRHDRPLRRLQRGRDRAGAAGGDRGRVGLAAPADGRRRDMAALPGDCPRRRLGTPGRRRPPADLRRLRGGGNRRRGVTDARLPGTSGPGTQERFVRGARCVGRRRATG